MLTRSARLKSWFYLSLYMGWFTFVVLFIMYRLNGNDLKELEIEAMKKIEIDDFIKQN